jgi:23S rRNA (adenine2503-C2)-methyltransferase
MSESFYKYSYPELIKLFEQNSLNTIAASSLFRWHYKYKKLQPCEIHLAQKSNEFIDQFFNFELPKIETLTEAKDQTVKFLIAFSDGENVECVLIPFQSNYTLCLSTQVGCAMNCNFCYTARQGLKRNLRSEEIIGQFLVAWHWMMKHRPSGHQIRNVVFMGQGEPLHNFDHVKKACEILVDQHGASVGLQRTTISTAGYLPGLKRWVNEMPEINIALSLHSAINEKRNQLIPIGKTYPLEEIMQYLDSIPLKKKQFITYEYMVIKNFNDGDEDIHHLGKLLQNRKALINLIAFNPFPGSTFQRPDETRIEEIQKLLTHYHIPTMIRGTKGDEILAACGQLQSSNKGNNNDK